jgi:hypothetical protein
LGGLANHPLPPASERAQVVASLQNTITKMAAMAKKQPMSTIKFEGYDFAMTPNVAIGYMERDLKSVKMRVIRTEIQKKTRADLAGYGGDRHSNCWIDVS